MSLDMDQIAEAFCSHQFAETYPYMADEIKWNIINREELVGREAVINQCNQSAKFLETVFTTLTKPKIYRMETCVVLEGTAQFRDQENETSGVASGDVFHFSEGRLIEITSYVIDLNKA